MSGRGRIFISTRTRHIGLLDPADGAIVKVVRAIWMFLLDGFAACGLAECGMHIDPNFISADRTEPAIRYAYGAVDDDLAGDFDDLDALIKSLRTSAD